jgi:hypothetical protein
MTACQKPCISDIFPEYKFLEEFSEKITPKTELNLWSYGINNNLPRGYVLSNDLANFTLSYDLTKSKDDEISLVFARKLLVSVVEAFLTEVDSTPNIRSQLEIVPLNSDRVSVSIYFIDKNGIELGQGISSIYFSKGKLKYEQYEILEYRDRHSTKGKHLKVHEETYEEALKIVREQDGPLKLIE